MNASHLHLFVNHFPFAGFLFALLALLCGWCFKSVALKRFALCTMALAGAIGVVAYLSGTAAEENGFGEGFAFQAEVERHEKSAETTWIVGIVAGVIGLGSVVLTRRMNDVPGYFMVASTFATLACLFFFMKTSNLGGQIQHPEIRADSMTKLINPRN